MLLEGKYMVLCTCRTWYNRTWYNIRILAHMPGLCSSERNLGISELQLSTGDNQIEYVPEYVPICDSHNQYSRDWP